MALVIVRVRVPVLEVRHGVAVDSNLSQRINVCKFDPVNSASSSLVHES